MDLETMYHNLYENVKPVVWVLIISGKFEGEYRENRQTAFAVKEGLIMSCARYGNWKKWSNLLIEARPLDWTKKTLYKAQCVFAKWDCDITLFRVIGDLVDMAVGKFGSGKLTVGQRIMCVGHPLEFVGSGMIGEVEYACPDCPTFSLLDDLICEGFDCNTWRRSPSHRVMGHVWNSGSIKRIEQQADHDIEELQFSRNLKGKLPIIQTTGLVGVSGASGSPMFNLNGEIIGMYVLTLDRFDIGIHVSALLGGLTLHTANSCSTLPSPSPSDGGRRKKRSKNYDQRK